MKSEKEKKAQIGSVPSDWITETIQKDLKVKRPFQTLNKTGLLILDITLCAPK